MICSKTLFHFWLTKITLNESPAEISSILYLIFDKEFKLNRTAILAEKKIEQGAEKKIEQYISRINKHEPVQYVLGEGYFWGRKFNLTPDVLIPREETERIVSLVKNDKQTNRLTLLDIGTGSGCLAITLALELPNAEVHALDISSKALLVAKQNATQLGANVSFHQLDILTQQIPVKNLDLIVSNPPYVTENEKAEMQLNVLQYEPAIALFVPNENPLVFYKAIAQNAITQLTHNGKLIVEINEKFGKEVAYCLEEEGLKVDPIIKDVNGKDRIVVAIKCN